MRFIREQEHEIQSAVRDRGLLGIVLRLLSRGRAPAK
jgi:hypothetical protein